MGIELIANIVAVLERRGSTSSMSDTNSETVERPKFGALHHISLPCRDVKEGISFYCELLGGDLTVRVTD